MYKVLLSAVVMTALLTSGGCALIYKPDIQQGNVINADNAARLKPGMSQEQVVALLGRPTIASPFNQNRWDYAYSLQKRGRMKVKKDFTVFFQNGVVVRTKGEFQDEDSGHMMAQVAQYPIVLHNKEKEAEERRQRGGG